PVGEEIVAEVLSEAAAFPMDLPKTIQVRFEQARRARAGSDVEGRTPTLLADRVRPVPQAAVLRRADACLKLQIGPTGDELLVLGRIGFESVRVDEGCDVGELQDP